MVFNFSADSREFTQYTSSCLEEQKTMCKNKVYGNDYRFYLQKNAEAIMEENKRRAIRAVKRI